MKMKWFDITWICGLNFCPLSSVSLLLIELGIQSSPVFGLMTEKLWTWAHVSYFLTFTYKNFYLPNETIYIQPCSQYGICKQCFCALMNYS